MGFTSLQHEGRTRGHGYETGQISFVTTGLTVAIATRFKKILGFCVTKMQSTGDHIERIYSSHTVSDAGTFTVTREVKPTPIRAAVEDVYLASNDWVMAPIGYSPFAGLITRLRVFHGVAFGGGTPIINLGKMDNTVVLVDNAGATDGFVVGELILAFPRGGC